MQNFKPNKDILTREYTKVWPNSKKMIDYCTNKVLAMATLPDGGLVVVDKEKIETHFCFDDSFDYEGAQDMAAHARKSTAYLKAKNMERLDAWIKDLNDTRYPLMISINGTYGNGENVFKALAFDTYNSYFDRTKYRPATEEEKNIILALYQYAREQHEKKVDAYIKRYGTSKVHSWTYWGMA